MPIYEYACEKCEHEFEVEQRMSDDPVKSCPKCRGRKVKRLISKTSFVLKGGGWYNDLYSSPSGKDAKSGGDDAKSSSSGESKSDSDSGSKSSDSKTPTSDSKSSDSKSSKAKGKTKAA